MTALMIGAVDQDAGDTGLSHLADRYFRALGHGAAISSLRLLAFDRNAQSGRLLENCGCWPLQTIGNGFQRMRRRGKLNQFALLFV